MFIVPGLTGWLILTLPDPASLLLMRCPRHRAPAMPNVGDKVKKIQQLVSDLPVWSVFQQPI